MVVVIQGLVILFSGALANMPRPWLRGCCCVAPGAALSVMDDASSLARARSLAATLRVATPLILCALGGLFSRALPA